MVSGVTVKAGETVCSSAMFYKAVVQSVLLYNSERWVITYTIMKVLEGSHHQFAWRIAGKTEWRVGTAVWDFHPRRRPCRLRDCGPCRIKSGYNRLPLRITLIHNQYMSYALGRKSCRGQFIRCSGKNSTIARRKGALESAEMRRVS